MNSIIVLYAHYINVQLWHDMTWYDMTWYDMYSRMETYVSRLYAGHYAVHPHTGICRFPSGPAYGSDTTTRGIRIQVCHVLLCHVLSHTSCHIRLYDMEWYVLYGMSCHIISCHIISYITFVLVVHVMWCYVISYHLISSHLRLVYFSFPNNHKYSHGHNHDIYFHIRYDSRCVVCLAVWCFDVDVEYMSCERMMLCDVGY